ncbi:hypothetical protein YC2023_081488 [Brassica napus]
MTRSSSSSSCVCDELPWRCETRDEAIAVEEKFENGGEETGIYRNCIQENQRERSKKQQPPSLPF